MAGVLALIMAKRRKGSTVSLFEDKGASIKFPSSMLATENNRQISSDEGWHFFSPCPFNITSPTRISISIAHSSIPYHTYIRDGKSQQLRIDEILITIHLTHIAG